MMRSKRLVLRSCSGCAHALGRSLGTRADETWVVVTRISAADHIDLTSQPREKPQGIDLQEENGKKLKCG